MIADDQPPIWVACPSCRGTGGLPDIFDEDDRRWYHRYCASCSGRGEVRERRS